MKVWVIMGNDYPDCVFATEEAAEKYLRSKMDDPANKLKYGGARIYWRHYEFEVRQ
jgi:hypothetical protein